MPEPQPLPAIAVGLPAQPPPPPPLLPPPPTATTAALSGADSNYAGASCNHRLTAAHIRASSDFTPSAHCRHTAEFIRWHGGRCLAALFLSDGGRADRSTSSPTTCNIHRGYSRRLDGARAAAHFSRAPQTQKKKNKQTGKTNETRVLHEQKRSTSSIEEQQKTNLSIC